jgi:hypothetical protein
MFVVQYLYTFCTTFIHILYNKVDVSNIFTFFFKKKKKILDTSTLLYKVCTNVVQQTLFKEKLSIHSFLTTAPQQADVGGNILFFFF